MWDLVEQKDKDLPIRETTGKEIVIPDLAAIDVETPDEFERVFADALAKRKVAVSRAYQHIPQSRPTALIRLLLFGSWISQPCRVLLALVHVNIPT